MRKSTFWTLALLVVSALFSISLISCSSDDDDDDNGVTSALTGRWENDDELADYSAFEFYKDGKGFAEQWPLQNGEKKGDRPDRWAISYSYDNATKHLVIHDIENGDSHDYDDIFIVTELTSDKLTVKWADSNYNESETFHKTK